MTAIPGKPEDMTAAWLTDALRASGKAKGAEVENVSCTQFGQGVGMISDLYRLGVTYRNGAAGPASLVAKLSSQRPESRGLAMAFGMYDREVRFYRDLAPTIDMSSATSYLSDYDAGSGDSIVLLADLTPAQSADQLGGMPLDEVLLAIDEIAKLHAAWWEHPELDAMEAVMPQLCHPPYSFAVENYKNSWAAADLYLKEIDMPVVRRVADRLRPSLQKLSEDICEGPRTLCHGDFRADNLMFLRQGGQLSMMAVDWQLLMQARGALDIGYLMGGHVASSLRREHERMIVKRYHDNLVRHGVTGYDFDQCYDDYRRCVLVGISYLVQALPTVDPTNPRAAELARSWADRLNAAITELGLEEFVP